MHFISTKDEGEWVLCKTSGLSYGSSKRRGLVCRVCVYGSDSIVNKDNKNVIRHCSPLFYGEGWCCG